MLVVGLTGSIGMGKSAVAARLRALGIPVCDADAEVHRLYEGAAVPAIEAAFPGTTAGGKVDRQKLAAVLLQRPQDFARLEAIVHPLVLAAERAFLRDAAARGAALAVLEVPLLFETGMEGAFDVVVCVVAPDGDREGRADGTGLAALEGRESRQLTQDDKAARASHVISNDGTLADLDEKVADLVGELASSGGGD